jgi:hypothetical protein
MNIHEFIVFSPINISSLGISLVFIWITYYYNRNKDFLNSLGGLINEIEGNHHQLEEQVFLADLNIFLNKVDGKNWLSKGISATAAIGVKSSYLYQYLIDNAFVHFVENGYILKIQENKYVKGGPFDNLAEFYYYCNQFNLQSMNYEIVIRAKLNSGLTITMQDSDVNELILLRNDYWLIIDTKYKDINILTLNEIIWDWEDKVVSIFFISIILLVILLIR